MLKDYNINIFNIIHLKLFNIIKREAAIGELHSEPLSVQEYQKGHHPYGELDHNPYTLPRCFTPNRLS